MIVSSEARERFEQILRNIKWIKNLCQIKAPSFTHGSLKRSVVNVCLNAIDGVEDAAEKLLLNDEKEALDALVTYTDKIHTEVIERTQTVYIGTKEGSERYLSQMQEEIEQYGFYKDGIGIKIV